MKTSIFIAAALIGLPLGDRALAGYAFTTLSDPSAAFGTSGSGINDLGVVVGTYTDGSGNQHGFTESGGTWSNFSVPGAAQTTGAGINNAGQVIGTSTDSGGQTHGYIRSGTSSYVGFDAPGGAGATTGTGINNAGNSTGYFFDGSTTHGLLNLTTVLDALGAVNLTVANGINAAGTVVGYYSDAGGAIHGFTRSSGGSYSTINDPLGAAGTYLTGINDSGEMVGYFVDGLGVTHGFLDNSGSFTTIDAPGAQGFTQINGINNAGVLVGTFIDATTSLQDGFVAVPEPATLSVLGFGAFVMTAIRRRRMAR